MIWKVKRLGHGLGIFDPTKEDNPAVKQEFFLGRVEEEATTQLGD